MAETAIGSTTPTPWIFLVGQTQHFVKNNSTQQKFSLLRSGFTREYPACPCLVRLTINRYFFATFQKTAEYSYADDRTLELFIGYSFYGVMILTAKIHPFSEK